LCGGGAQDMKSRVKLSTAGEAFRASIAAGLALGAALVLSSSSARAQSTQAAPRDVAAAEALFRAGRDLIAAGRYEEGCPKFQASFNLDPSVGTLLNIAKCHEHDGKLMTAREEYARALVLTRDIKDPGRQKTLDGITRQGISAVELRLPKLVVTIVPSPLPPGLEVVRDGQKMAATALAEAVPLDPGRHEVTASAPGYRTVTRPVTLEEGKTATVEIALTSAAAAEGKSARPSSGLRIAGIALTTAGGAGLALGAITGILALDKVSAVEAGCHGTICLSTNQTAHDGVNAATTLGNVSTAAFIAGGVLAATGVVLLVLPSRGEAKASAVNTFIKQAVIKPGFIEIQGRF
jgi:tetratricopeptide (TPR) repeat protein